MRRVMTATVVAMLAGSIGVRGDDTATRWWSHVEALANDGMEGRDTGSPGHKRAAEYVAAQFKKSGLEPAGIGGYIQPVAFKTRRIVEAKSSLALVKSGAAQSLTLGEDANISMRVDPAPSVDAPLVFVGYGLNIPERNINDFAGVNLKGAIAVYISSTPKSLPGPLQAHFGSAGERWKMYKAAGAIGTLSIANPKSMDVPWARSTLARLQPAMSLADATLDEAPGQQLSITMNPARADKLFAGSGHTFAELLALVDGGKAVPSFALPSRLQATVAVERSQVESQNVAGILRGSDPKRRDEFVVVSAHLDHVGIGGAVNGDALYNGAMDNASGIAAMLDVAATLHDKHARPKRSLLFVAVCGEEKGLLGSRYFASHPTVEGKQIVADINSDMFLPLFPLKQLTAFGAAGAGQTTKMVNQICIAGVLQGVSEGLRFAQAAELDLEKVFEAISGGAAQSWQMENRWKTMAQDSFDFGFAVDWMRKDLGLALDEARVSGATLPVTAMVDQFYADVQALGGGRQDTSSLVRRITRA